MLAMQRPRLHQEKLPEGHRAPSGRPPKREGPVDVVAVVLGRTTQQHVATTVTIRGRNGWVPLRGILDTGATRTFILQLRVKELGLAADKERPPGVATLGRDALATYACHVTPMRLKDSSGRAQTVTGSMIAANITGYDIILGNDWLKRFCKAIYPPTEKWAWERQPGNGMAPAVGLVEATSFAAILKKEDAQPYAWYGQRFPEPGEATESLWGTGAVRVPPEYLNYVYFFSERAANELPKHGPQDHAIDLVDGGTVPFGPLYNLSASELKVLRDYINENLAKGFIRASTSPAGAPILFVKKKDGTLRLCVDYRGLNRVTIKNRYPLPLISEALDRLVSAKVYTKLDIRSAYNLVRIREGDEWKTAFRTRYGHFEYRVMPFGLANALGTFQGYINTVLRDYLDIFCIAYLDDILIYSDSDEEHAEHVRRVLGRLAKHGLYAKLEKCEFSTKQVGFVGYIVTPNDVSMEEDRVATIRDWPAPSSRRDIQVFLGFANFYRRFIQCFFKITKPLTRLLSDNGPQDGRGRNQPKDSFVLTDKARGAFDNLKEAFTSAPVLVHYDLGLCCRLETDASGYAIAGILSQL